LIFCDGKESSGKESFDIFVGMDKLIRLCTIRRIFYIVLSGGRGIVRWFLVYFSELFVQCL
jgi:hypothetical protein